MAPKCSWPYLLSGVLVTVCSAYIHKDTYPNYRENNVRTFTYPNKIGVARLYDYTTKTVVYKDYIDKICYIELMQGQPFWEERQFDVVIKPLARDQIKTIGGERVASFCLGFLTTIIQQPLDYPLSNEIRHRPKRSTSHYFVGRTRGQTQSQYLSFGRTNEPGRAEAESNNEGSRATVSGTNGMGQAQSQSNPFSCADCFGGVSQQYPGSQQQTVVPGTQLPGQQLYQITDGRPPSQGIQLIGDQTPGIPSYIPGYGAEHTLPGGPGVGEYQERPSISRPGEIVRPGGGFITETGRPSTTGARPGEAGPPGHGQITDTNQIRRPGETDGSVQTISPGLGQVPGYPGYSGVTIPGQVPGYSRQPGEQGLPGQVTPPSYSYPGFPGASGRPGETGLPGQVSPPGYPYPGQLTGVPSASARPGELGLPGQVPHPGYSYPGQVTRFPGAPGAALPGESYPPGSVRPPTGPGEIKLPGTPGEEMSPGQQRRPGHVGRPGFIYQQPAAALPGQVSAPGYPYHGQLTGVPGALGRPGKPELPGQVSPPGYSYPGQMTGFPGAPGTAVPSETYPPGSVRPPIGPGEINLPGMPGEIISPGQQRRPGQIDRPGLIYQQPGQISTGLPGQRIPGSSYTPRPGEGDLTYHQPGRPGFGEIPGRGETTATFQQQPGQPTSPDLGVGPQYGRPGVDYPNQQTYHYRPDVGTPSITEPVGPHRGGTFLGNVAGNYQSHAGDAGQFYGKFSGTYDIHSHYLGPPKESQTYPVGPDGRPSVVSTGLSQTGTDGQYTPGQGVLGLQPGAVQTTRPAEFHGGLYPGPGVAGGTQPGEILYPGQVGVPSGGYPVSEYPGTVHPGQSAEQLGYPGGRPPQGGDQYRGQTIGVTTYPGSPSSQQIPGRPVYTGQPLGPGYVGGPPGTPYPPQVTETRGPGGVVFPSQPEGTRFTQQLPGSVGYPGQIPGAAYSGQPQTPTPISGYPGQIPAAPGYPGQITRQPGGTTFTQQLPGSVGYPGQIPGAGYPGQPQTPAPISGYPGQIPGSGHPGRPQTPGSGYPGQPQIPESIRGYPGQISGSIYPGQSQVPTSGSGYPGQMPGSGYPGQPEITTSISGYPGQGISGYPSTVVVGQVPTHPGYPGQLPYAGLPSRPEGAQVSIAGPSGTLDHTDQIPGRYTGDGIKRPSGEGYPPTGYTGTIPGGYTGAIPGGGQISEIPQGTGYPGNYGTGYVGPDDSDSQAETSIHQISNGTQTSASAQGKHQGGTAQSQVSGIYSGSGSFSASAGSNDGKRGAQTQISGGKEGSVSSAQGTGGRAQSQTQVQMSSDTGDASSSAQAMGFNHGSLTQVQAGGKGGMADAQANGPGSTSSQAQIGFSPYEDNQEESQGGPFGGGASASAQSGSNAGQSQVQIQGKYKYGIKYTGGAQASSSNSGIKTPAKFSTMKPIDFSIHKKVTPEKTSPLTTEPQRTDVSQAKLHSTVKTTTTPTPDAVTDDSEEYVDYEEYTEAPHPLHSSNKSHLAERPGKIDPVEDISTPTHVKPPMLRAGTVLEPGQTVPGSEGYRIPSGFRGVVSEADSHTIQGIRRMDYNKPVYAVGARTNVRNGEIGYGSGYSFQPMQIPVRSGKPYPKFVGVSKSETGSQNTLTGKKTPSVYYTQSSSCGYFTNTCFYSNGQKICLPKPKTNPDGTPIIC